MLPCLAVGFFLSSCSELDDQAFAAPKSQNKFELRTDLDITAIHDEYCKMIADSIIAWRANNELDTSKFVVVWKMINDSMALTLGVHKDTIAAMFSRMGITRSNFTKLHDLRYLHFSNIQAAYLDSLESKSKGAIDSSTTSLMAILSDEIESWGGTIDSNGINSLLAVANSTFPFWRENFDVIDTSYNPLDYAAIDPKRKRGAAHLALGDATGALWGLLGGPGSALLGAVGSTLGAAIDMAVFGY